MIGQTPFGEDWLVDPLVLKSSKYSLDFREPLADSAKHDWPLAHFATRVKLEGAAYFLSQLLGASSLDQDVGLALLISRQLDWFSGAFFFELLSAYDTLLQEINLVYACNLDKVEWNKLRPKLTQLQPDLIGIMGAGWNSPWFKNVRWYRNYRTHQMLIPRGQLAGGTGEPWNMEVEKVELRYLDEEAGQIVYEDISTCKDYFRSMIAHIRQIWGVMSKEFEPLQET